MTRIYSIVEASLAFTDRYAGLVGDEDTKPLIKAALDHQAQDQGQGRNLKAVKAVA